MTPVLTAAVALTAALLLPAGGPTAVRDYVETHCVSCHDPETKKGGLDLSALRFDPADPAGFAAWVKVHDRVRDGEMPPQGVKHRPDNDSTTEFLAALAAPLAAADRDRVAREGRATMRRLNRYEYENTLRDLFAAPWLRVREMLPEDAEAHRFNKVGAAMDVSHVHMARYMEAADHAVREVLAAGLTATRPVRRYYARDEKSFARQMEGLKPSTPERRSVPLLDDKAQLEVMAKTAPVTVGAADPTTREREAFGVVASNYIGNGTAFDEFKAPASGHYRIRVSLYTIWAGPGPGDKWWRADLKNISRGRTTEPVTVYAKGDETRRVGAVDATPDPSVREFEADLMAGETVKADAGRLMRSRPGWTGNPLAARDGQPGVAFRWVEVEGPLHAEWPAAGRRLMFGDLPVKRTADKYEVESTNPEADADRLLRGFLTRAYRRPAAEPTVQRLLAVVRDARTAGVGFGEAMILGYTAALSAPEFLYFREAPGELDGPALAARLSFFLCNSPPDAELRALGESGAIKTPEVLRAQADRLLADPKVRRFTDAFLDYWLDLRNIEVTGPDVTLYPDYALDDLLTESAEAETRLYFTDLLRRDRPARELIASDFTYLNDHLAAHYDLPPVGGVAMRKATLPPDSVRGGFLTQASVLKVTANGTTTSPVLRGVWVAERLLGVTLPPPPAGVPGVEPDTRGATTIREQLDKHRQLASCAGCHAKIDPAGFALESFDVCGGSRDRYRSTKDGDPASGVGKNGFPFTFRDAKPVDPSGELPDGRAFRDVRELKRLILADEKQVARNLARQLVVYATGAPVGFADRADVETILAAAGPDLGVRSLVHGVIQNRVFQCK